MLRFSLHLLHIFLKKSQNVQLIMLSPNDNIAIMVGCGLLSYIPQKISQNNKISEITL
jgi:hypothetical protein